MLAGGPAQPRRRRRRPRRAAPGAPRAGGRCGPATRRGPSTRPSGTDNSYRPSFGHEPGRHESQLLAALLAFRPELATSLAFRPFPRPRSGGSGRNASNVAPSGRNASNARAERPEREQRRAERPEREHPRADAAERGRYRMAGQRRPSARAPTRPGRRHGPRRRSAPGAREARMASASPSRQARTGSGATRRSSCSGRFARARRASSSSPAGAAAISAASPATPGEAPAPRQPDDEDEQDRTEGDRPAQRRGEVRQGVAGAAAGAGDVADLRAGVRQRAAQLVAERAARSQRTCRPASGCRTTCPALPWMR